jgi:hypothetical protein
MRRGRDAAARNLKALHKTKLYQEITEQIEWQSREAI